MQFRKFLKLLVLGAMNELVFNHQTPFDQYKILKMCKKVLLKFRS